LGPYEPKWAHEAVETEALSQHVIVQILKDELDALLVPGAVEEWEERSQSGRLKMEEYLREFPL
jgi:hypothetical protein